MMYGEGLSTATHKFICYDSIGHVWNGASFEAWLDAHYSTYLSVSATQNGLSGRFYALSPTGSYSYRLTQIVDSTLANDIPVWDGDVNPPNFPILAIASDGTVGVSTGA